MSLGSGQSVYLSYAPIDAEKMFRVQDILLEGGAKLWRPPVETHPFEARRQGILSVDLIVFLITPAFKMSELCRGELAIATSIGCRYRALVDGHTDITRLPLAPDRCTRLALASVTQEDLVTITESPRGNTVPVEPEPASGQPHDVFISFSSEDAADAKALRQHLTRAGIRVWDFRFAPRHYETYIYDELQKAIDACAVFIAVDSDSFDRSEWTRDEYAYASATGRRLLHVRFRPKQPTVRAAGRAYIDCIANRASGLDATVETVQRLISHSSIE